MRNATLAPLRITHINSYFGTNSVHRELVQRCADLPLLQSVFIPAGRTDKWRVGQPEEVPNTTFDVSPCFSTATRLLWPLKAWSVAAAFKRHMESGASADVVHAHSLMVNGLAAYAYCRSRRIPYVVTVRHSDIRVFLRLKIPFRSIAGAILRAATDVVLLSPVYRDVHLRRALGRTLFGQVAEKCTVIPNGIDDFWLAHESRERRRAGSGPLRLLFVGQLCRNKNVGALLRARNILEDEGIPCRVEVVGDGPRPSRQLGSTGTFEKVAIRGFVNSEVELREIYRSNDILVVPSFWESFGRVYVEAMSQGLPVVYSREQGFDGQFPDGHVGRAVDPRDPRDIAGKVKLILQEYEEVAKRAREGAARFSWARVTRDLLSVYTSAANAYPTASRVH